MTATALESQLVIGAILFILGMIGFLTRRNLILIMLSAELMLHGVSINLTAFSRYHGNPQGDVFTIFVLTIAACEAGLALAMILSLYQRRKSLDVNLWGKLGEEDLPVFTAPPAPQAPVTPDPNLDLPHLTPAGRMPKTPTGTHART
ncbi:MULTISPECIES: NADH-quinone oxidoreductase subunit NuoK [unclassified Schlesneria]|uniref:NADH-quinone oxidoreductase subunit NuoK n=1 Tax=Schlesneria TaxID=656899 RepID=UPI002EE2D697